MIYIFFFGRKVGIHFITNVNLGLNVSLTQYPGRIYEMPLLNTLHAGVLKYPWDCQYLLMKRRQGGNERKFFNRNSHKVQVVKPKRIDTPLSPTHSVPTRDEQWRYQRTLLSHNNLVRCWKASAKFVITSEKKLSWLQAVSGSFFNVTEGKLQTEHMIYFNDKLTSIILLQSNAHGTLFRLKLALKSL